MPCDGRCLVSSKISERWSFTRICWYGQLICSRLKIHALIMYTIIWFTSVYCCYRLIDCIYTICEETRLKDAPWTRLWLKHGSLFVAKPEGFLASPNGRWKVGTSCWEGHRCHHYLESRHLCKKASGDLLKTHPSKTKSTIFVWLKPILFCPRPGLWGVGKDGGWNFVLCIWRSWFPGPQKPGEVGEESDSMIFAVSSSVRSPLINHWLPTNWSQKINQQKECILR